MDGIYFDNAATTPLCDAARAELVDSLDHFANPSSAHTEGYAESKRLDQSRRVIASLAGASPDGVIFTSGGTEADCLALNGGTSRRAPRIVISDSEHPAVTRTAEVLARRGYELVRIPTVGGRLDLDALREAVAGKKTSLVSVMHVNNETGAIYDVKSASRIVKDADKNALFHCDCVQSFGKLPFTLSSLGADMISVSAHKIGGPKGVGALITAPGVRLEPLITGGGQERGIRSGTENTWGIRAFAAAARHAAEAMETGHALAVEIRDTLTSLLGEIPGVVFNVPEKFDPHVLSVTLPGVKSEVAVRMLSDQGLFVSAGSACSSKLKVSPVLKAFGLSDRDADRTLRLSFGEQNTVGEARIAARLIAELARRF